MTDSATLERPHRSANTSRVALLEAPTIWWITIGAAVVLMSVATVLRDTALNLSADGVEQSVMSVQHVSLFYWGQDRLFPVVSLLASPVSNPTANFFLCLFLQALSFFSFFLLVCHRAARSLFPDWSVRHTAVIFFVTAGVLVSIFSSQMMFSFALEGQPYALSWLLALASFLLWRVHRTGSRAASLALAFVALGVNPSVLLFAAFLALGDLIRSRAWTRWILFGTLWVMMFGLWTLLATRFGTFATPEKVPTPGYLSFSVTTLTTGLGPTVSNVTGSLRPVRLVGLSTLALLSLASISRARRDLLARFGSLFGGFTVLFVALFAGNEWVRMNAYHYRYFFPLPVLIGVAISLPIAVALLELPAVVSRTTSSAVARHLATPLVAIIAIGVAVVGSAGPVTLPSNSVVFQQLSRTESYAKGHGVTFLSGDYWTMWPLLHLLQKPGRDAVFVAGFKSGGNRSDYRAALVRSVRKDGYARALCVDSTIRTCVNYLDYWTRPGWERAHRLYKCPSPGLLSIVGSAPRVCRVLEFHPSN